MSKIVADTVSRVPGLRRLLLGRGLSFLGTAVVPTALTLALIQTTGRAGDLGLVLAAELAPQLLLLPIGGVLADRFPVRLVAVGADLVRGLAQLAIGIEFLLGVVRITDLVVLSVITGIGIAFGTPTMSPLVAGIVPAEHRMRANGRLGVIRGLALVVGPGIAGVVIVVVGPGWLFVLTALVFFGAAAALLGLRLARPSEDGSTRPSFFGQLVEGWQEVRSRPWFWSNLIGHGVSNLAAGVLMTLGPLIAIQSLGGELAWVLIYQTGMVGLVVGAFVAPKVKVRRPLVFTSACGALFAAPMATFAVPLPAWINAVAYGVGMLGIGMLNTVWQSTMQRLFPPHALARADSYDALLSFAARPLGLAVAAPLAALTGNAIPLLVLAGLVAGTNLAIIALPDVRAISSKTELAAQRGRDRPGEPENPSVATNPEKTRLG